jgi:hypothetical protein
VEATRTFSTRRAGCTLLLALPLQEGALDMSVSKPPLFDREGILRELWADPIAGTLWRAIPARLRKGEEYLDLQHLERGVQRAEAAMSPTGGELPRVAVEQRTWVRLLTYLMPLD